MYQAQQLHGPGAGRAPASHRTTGSNQRRHLPS